MSKLYELAIDNGDENTITNFRVANNIDELTQDILSLRLTHPTDTIQVWELTDELERTTDECIHVFNQTIQDLESGKIELPRPPQIPSPMHIMGGISGGFIEIVPGECFCGQCGIDDQMELGLDDGEL